MTKGPLRAALLNRVLAGGQIGPDPATKMEAAGFSATTALKRSEFGIETALALVGDDVEIRIEALAHVAADGD